MKMPRSALIHLTASEYGGVETHVYHLARVLRQAGVQVALTSQRRLAFNQAWADDLERSGVELVAPPTPASRMTGVAGLAISRAWLRWQLRGRFFDMVIGQGHGGAFAWMRRFLAPNGLFVWHEYWYGVPTHGDRYQEYRVPEPRRFPLRMRRMVGSLDVILVGCERARRNLRLVQEVSVPVAVVPPLTHLDGVPPASDRCYDQHSPIKILMAGRMGFGKGLGTLIRVWNALDLGDAELHLYGPVESGFARKAVSRLSGNDRIVVHGPFVRRDLPRVLGEADLGLMLSIEEGYGLVVWEYMACGLPFVMTDCGAAEEFTAENPDGLKVDVSEEGICRGLDEMVRRLRDNRLSRSRLQAFHRRCFSHEVASAQHVQAVIHPAEIWPELRPGRNLGQTGVTP